MAAIAWTWREWSGWGATLAEAAIAFLGFGIAIYELRRTRSAAEETARTASRTQLLALTQSMRAIERDLDASLPNRRSNAIRALNDWRAAVVEYQGVLARLGDPPASLVATLQESRDIAAYTKNELQLTSRPPVTDTTKKARDLISSVCDEAAQFTSTIT